MRPTPLGSRLSSKPQANDYLLALGLAALAVALRLVLDKIVPGFAFFLLTLPIVVMAGVFCGTAPAVLTAVIGGLGVAWLHFGRQLLGRPLNFAQTDTLTFALAAGTILWGTHTLRRIAAEAAASEARLAEVFRQIPAAAGIVEAPSGKLLLTSTKAAEVLGVADRARQGGAPPPVFSATLPDGGEIPPGDYPILRALQRGEVVQGQKLLVRRPDGSTMDMEVHAGPVRNAAGAIVAAVSMAFDVSERVLAEQRLRESETLYRHAAERLQTALDARDVVMREADHRIKNSLQLVGALLRLQRDRVSDADAGHALDAAIARVTAVADAHLAFEQSTDLRHLDIGRSLQDLCRRIGPFNPAVELRCTVPDGLLLDGNQAIPLGLIASELLTNALRHAFAPGEGGTVTLSLEPQGGALCLTIADGGQGLPEAAVRRGLGSKVVETLARQIGATINTQSTPGHGTTVTVRVAAE